MAEAPPERTVSWPACWSLLACATTLVVTLAPMWAGVPRSVHVVGVLALAAGVTWGLARHMYMHRRLAHLAVWRPRMVCLMRVGGGAYFLWSAGFLVTPHHWSGWALALLVLVGGTYGGASWCQHVVARRPVPELARPTILRASPEPVDEVRTKMQEALDNARNGWLEVVDWAPVKVEDRVVGVRYMARVRDGITVPDADQLKAERIATTLSHRIGVELQTDWVQVRRRKVAGRWDITTVLEDVMGRVRPYVDDPTPTSIKVAPIIGYDVEGQPYRQDLRLHCQDCGQTRWGKSSLINVKWAHITRCTDAVLWVCGTEKMWDLLAGWLEPYRDTGRTIPIDWIMRGPQDSLTMLIALMTLARWRQNTPLHARAQHKDVILQLDEASFLLRNTQVRGTYQGRLVTPSQIMAMIHQGAGSARCWANEASQGAVGSHSGPEGQDVIANTGYRTVFRSGDQAELGRVLGWKHFKMEQPPHPGCFWIRPAGEDPLLLRAPYIQEVDPQRPVLHNGATISDVSWARRDIPRGLDPASAAALGGVYANRYTVMDDRLDAYLRSDPTFAPEDDEERRNVAEMVNREADAYLAQLVSPVSLPERRSRKDTITEIVRAAGGPIETAQIIEELRTRGDAVSNETAVSNQLAQQVKDGLLHRLDKGLYVATEGEHTTPHHTTPLVSATSANGSPPPPGGHV